MLTIKNRLGKKRLLVLTLAVLLAGCSPPGPRALLRGKKLLDQGRYPEAAVELKIATSLLGTNAQAWNYLGLACHYEGQITNAITAYQRALALDHDLVEAHYNLGCLWLEQGRLDSAKSEFTSFTSLRRGSVDGWLKLGAAELRTSRQGGAARALELAAAEQSYGQALRLAPQNPDALNGLGLIQLQRNRPREASLFFSHALKQQPDYAPALLNLAVVSQVYLNNPALALQKYREYLALPNRAGRDDSVQAAARQLESELNPSRAAAPSPAARAPYAPVPAPAPAARAEKPSEPPSAATATRTATPAPAPEQRMEVTRVPAQPEPRPAQDAASSPQASSSPSQARSAAAAKTDKTEKRGFFSRINPLNVLHRSSKTNQAAVASMPAPAGPSSAASVAPPETASGGMPRYKYLSPRKPPAGDPSAAEGPFAEGLRAQDAGHLSEAIQDYRKSIRLDPADYDAHYNLGLALMAGQRLAGPRGLRECIGNPARISGRALQFCPGPEKGQLPPGRGE